MYALRAGPLTPGACPSTWSVRPVVSLATSASSPAITPGKFIISATPIVRWRRRRLSMSPVVNGRRGDSKRDAGKHVDRQLGRLDVHVRVDESRHEVRAGDVHPLAALVASKANDVAVLDGDV